MAEERERVGGKAGRWRKRSRRKGEKEERGRERARERHYASAVLLNKKRGTGGLLLKSHSSLYCPTLSMQGRRDNGECSQCDRHIENTGVH